MTNYSVSMNQNKEQMTR